MGGEWNEKGGRHGEGRKTGEYASSWLMGIEDLGLDSGDSIYTSA